LYGADTSHLATGLDGHDQNGAAEVWPATEEIEVCDFLLRSLFRYLELDEVVLSQNIWVVDVSVRVQFSKCS
jgi:hypothetical protein